MFAYCLNKPVNMIDQDGFDPVPIWAIRINEGTASAQDYGKALSVDPNAWIGNARRQIDKAISIAQTNYCTTSYSDYNKEFALYDSDRFEDKTAWRDTFISGGLSGPSWNPSEGSVGLGAISIYGTTGGWEGEYGSLKIFNFGHAEAGLEYRDGNIRVGAIASIWSPEASINLGDHKVGIGAEVGAFGIRVRKSGSVFQFKIGLGFGFSINIDW